VTLPTVTDNHYDLGLGITVQIDQQKVQVGSLRFILQETASTVAELPHKITQAMDAAAEHTFILIAIDGNLQGMIELRPQLRPEIKGLLKKLRKRQITQLIVLSGDQQDPTQRLADSLGLDAAYGEVLPQDKARFIQQLQSQGRQVCFIGDGLNDAIAMKQANVSISFNSAAPIASETAQIVLTNDTLKPVDQLFTMSEQLHQRLSKNLRLWIGFGLTNALAVPLLGFGPFQSSLFYLSVYGIGLKYSRRTPTALPTKPSS
jgi:Cu2+-exporting ATPase